MITRSLQLFSIALFLGALPCAPASELKTGAVQPLTFEDVDGHELSTANGHVTIVTVVTRDNEDKAHAVADKVPDRYVGDLKYHYITLVNFQGKLSGILQGMTRAMIRRRLDGEAKTLRPQYETKKIDHDPRGDLYVVADFDGKAVAQLGLAPASEEVSVFVFNREGKLIQQWTDVPPDDSLAKAIAAAE